jgi:hypothetical protein
MLSRPDGWRFASRRIAERGKDGRDSVLSGLSELREAGLLRYGRETQDDGTLLWVYEVSDEVVPEWGRRPAATSGKPGRGTTSGLPTSGKPGRLITLSEQDPPLPPTVDNSDPVPPTAGGDQRIETIIAAAIVARLAQPGVFRQGVRAELDNDEVRSRVRRWLVDFPGATDSLYAGCLADGTTTALRGYQRPDIDDELYAAYDTPAETEPAPARPSLRLIPSPEAYQEAPGG